MGHTELTVLLTFGISGAILLIVLWEGPKGREHMAPDLRFYIFGLFVLSLSLVLAGALLSLARQSRMRQEQRAAERAACDGYYCYNCGPTYAPLYECWLHSGPAIVQASLCQTCAQQLGATVVCHAIVRGQSSLGYVRSRVKRHAAKPAQSPRSPLKW